MIRTRIVVLATTASIALAGVVTPAAVAGSHWSRARCAKTYDGWYKHRFGSKISLTTKQAKEVTAYIKKLEREHHCVIGG